MGSQAAKGPTRMHVEVIETLERVFELELQWDELYKKDPHAHLYVSSRFMSAVALRAAGKFRILAAWSETGECIGILPLVVTTKWSKTGACLYNVLDMLGHVFDADYTGILCDPGFEAEVCEAFGHAVAAMPVGRIVLNFVSGPTSRLDAFIGAFNPDVFAHKENEHLINDGQTNNLLCPYIDLPDSFPAYLEGLSKNSRQKIRRLLRQLDSDATLRVTRSRPETYTEDVTILSKLWFLQYAERKGHKRATRLAELFKDVVMLGLAAGIIHLSILWRNGKPVAAQANYIDLVKRQALFHVGGRDERVQDLSSGLMLQAHCIRWAIANGLERYDFTIGDEPYKYSLGAVDRKITSVEVFTKSGANVTGHLDSICQDDVVRHIRKYVRKGRSADAKTAAQQAMDVWPDLVPGQDVETLIAQISETASR